MFLIKTHFFYLGILCLGILGLIILDYKYKLAFFCDPKSSIFAILPVMLLLLLADMVGVAQNIFFTYTDYVSNWYIASQNLPVEELIFLLLLCYITLIVYRIANRLVKKHSIKARKSPNV